MKLRNTFTILFLSLCWISCKKDEAEKLPEPSAAVIEMEGESGIFEVQMGPGQWQITGVLNKKGLVAINGDSYAPDGKLTGKNNVLTLAGPGKLEALWKDKGFSIVRNDLSLLKIALNENSTGEDFSFVVKLQSDQQSREITVLQKKSKGYLFSDIAYSLREGDGDSLFTAKGTTYNVDVPSAGEFSFSPFSGININQQTYFESRQDDAFVWLKDSAVLVKVPSGIEKNAVYYSGDKTPYSSETTANPYKPVEAMKTVLVPAGKSQVFAEIEYRKRKVSYTLNLTNNRTKAQKVIEGKWIQITPTGKYAVRVGN
jgi:hypothetical protein